MSVPVLTFFNNKGGVGKTSLAYHLSWMFSDMGQRVVAIDLDPQANLTSAFLPEEQLELLWDDNKLDEAQTIYQCVRPLTEVGDILKPATHRITSRLRLVAGDLSLAGFEDFLSQEWPNSLGSGTLYRPFRVLTAFWQVAQMAAQEHEADLILADVGPNLGAINRSALIGSDHVIIPLAADLFSLQGLRNLGPTLRAWRVDWKKRLSNWPSAQFQLPAGAMSPEGYIVQQHIERLSRPVQAYSKWAERIPAVYRSSVLDEPVKNIWLENDPYCLARLKHYRSLVPMAQEARKPIFKLSAADGAIGSHSYAVLEAREHFKALASQILGRIGMAVNA
ncbi:MAG: AAA family ATPase [Gammaproteobacteria bacterium]|nr:AAA family ATPase [Gammaproteobacteria bacterium]